MTSFKELQTLQQFIATNNLPKEQILYLNDEEYKSFCGSLKYIGANGIDGFVLPGTEPEFKCDVVNYGECTFYIIKY